MALQQTLAIPVSCQGIGLHSGKAVNLKVLPAKENTGFLFKRVDLSSNNMIEATYANVVDTKMCTVIANEYGVKVATIEHLMSALWGCGIDNAVIEVDAEEMPAMDGSSAAYVALFEKAGLKLLDAPRKYIEIVKPIKIEDGDKVIELAPNQDFVVDCKIEFDHKIIGEQSYLYNQNEDSYNFDISRARTFGFLKDLEYLKQNGLAKGASLDNAVGLDEEKVLNPEGLRYFNEFVRHKILDCIGDLYLAGLRIKCMVKISKSGHGLHNLILRKLFAEPESYKISTSFIPRLASAV
jgi:UDP-3-O-[3-hydroxymyristoyl] N-acetylglucosamine deacetylase